jgi:C-5 cytosine-specific DNA methylase
MLDLFAGTKGASRAFAEAGWEVVTVDNDPAHEPDVVADLRSWSWDGRRPELVWASPPCQEFSRTAMPWCRAKGPPEPSMELVEAALRVVEETRPHYWALENVRGAVPYIRPLLGEPRVIAGPFHLWGYFPPFRLELPAFKERLGSKDVVKRAAVPRKLSAALLDAVTRQVELPLGS